jgi:hypothetical protein
MKIYIDNKAVKRNSIIGKILRWTSLGCMLIGLMAVFSQEVAENPSLFMIFFSIMLVGVVISSISSYFTTRFGKSPRPDELIDKAFKGLDDRFHLFHYQYSIPHLLICPAGVWSVTPTFVDGEIVFNEKKSNWEHKKNSLINRFLSKEYFPNPVSDLKLSKKEFDKFLKMNQINQNVEIKSLIILMNKSVENVENNETDSILILPIDKVKDKFRKLLKNNTLSVEFSESLVEQFYKK